jgi:RNA polymerase sigma factor (sigma-70 family)
MRRSQEPQLSGADPLIAAAIAGEPQAMAAVLARYEQDILRFARHLCQGEQAEDVAQETMLIIARYLPTFHQAARFTSWLFVIVKRECQRRLFGRPTSALGEHIAPTADASAPLEGQEKTARIQAALAQLSEKDREILLLHACHHLTVAEIAIRFELTLPAAKSRLLRARLAMRDLLGPYADELGVSHRAS